MAQLVGLTDLQKIKDELEAHEQGHIFATFPDLTMDSPIIKQLTQECQNWKKTLSSYKAAKVSKPVDLSNVTPLNNVVKLVDTDNATNELRWNLGKQAILEGKIAAVIMSGGQGTRLGFNGPKGMYDIGLPSKKSIFQMHLEKILGVWNMCSQGTGDIKPSSPGIPVYIMTSSFNNDEIKQYFAANNNFGYPEDLLYFFSQNLEPCLTLDGGNIIIESENSLSMAPDGNGGLYGALQGSGALDDMRRRGVDAMHIYGIDNMLTKSCDPAFIGLCRHDDVQCGNKVVWRASKAEKVGVTIELAGRMAIVEYSDISKEMADATDSSDKLIYGAGNICNHYVTVDFIATHVLTDLNGIYHLASKKIPYFDPERRCTVTPESNNGAKMEMFIFDVFPLASRWAVMEVRREDEFAPVKNAPGSSSDSPDTARTLISGQSFEWLEAAGARVFDAKGQAVNREQFKCGAQLDASLLCEVSPLLSYQGENLEKYRGVDVVLPCYLA